MPDLVITETAAPEAPPDSASMLPVTTLTDSIVSAGGMYTWAAGRNAFTRFVPSFRVVCCVPSWPPMMMFNVPCGRSVSLNALYPGCDPGTRLSSI